MTIPESQLLEMWQTVSNAKNSSIHDFIRKGKSSKKEILFVVTDDDLDQFPIFFNLDENNLLKEIDYYNSIFMVSPPYLINEEKWTTLNELREIYRKYYF
jgi:hypothetical protein